VLAECDFLVIGAGIAGASVACELGRAHRVILLEREPRPGYHATGRSAALHSEIYGNPTIRALTRASRGFFLDPPAGLPSFARPRGCLHIATPEDLERLERFAAEPDVAASVRRLDGGSARELVPALRPGVVVAALSETNAYDLDVDRIHRHFLDALRVAGGRLECRAEVASLERSRGAWRAGLTDERQFLAQTVINAAGAWGDAVGALAGAAAVRLQPLRRTAALIDAPPGLDARPWPAVIDVGERFYFKPEAGQLLLSPADETPSEPCDAYPDDLDLAIAVERMQAVADVPVNRAPRAWAGLRTFAPDRSPVVGYDPALPGFFWLVGQGGYGIQTAPALSRVAAALAQGRAIPGDVVDCGLVARELAPQRFASADVGALEAP